MTRLGVSEAYRPYLERVEALGRERLRGFAATTELLTPALLATAHQAPRIERDLAYGDDPRHRLDVHTTDSADGPRPVLLFVHGGGFVGGEKHVAGRPHYDHIGAWAVRQGMVGVTMSYRLAPEHGWPAGAQDVTAAASWLRDRIESYGGDPERIVLHGHSAGAAHVAAAVAGQGGALPDGIRGAILQSGIYDPARMPDSPINAPYYGTELAAYPERSAIPGLRTAGLPLLLGLAEWDPPEFHLQAALLLQALAEDGAMPAVVTALGHNHITEALSFGLDDGAFADAVARFVHAR